MSVLEVQNLNKSFQKGFVPKKQEVLKGISFSLEPGTITGFVGSNGSGKTTTMKCVLELIFPDSGDIRFFGGQKISAEVKSRIGFLPEHPYFYDYLTGMEFLRFYGQVSQRMNPSDLKERINEILKAVGLNQARDKKLRDYSKGMLQRIGIAQALIHEPELVILDEPMSGVDPDGRFHISEIIRSIAQLGTAVFFSSHLLHDAEQLCERLVILHEGKVAFEGPTQDFLGGFDKKVKMEFLEEGQIKSKTFPNIEALQPSLRELAVQNIPVVNIVQEKVSLEEAFIRLSEMGASK